MRSFIQLPREEGEIALGRCDASLRAERVSDLSAVIPLANVPIRLSVAHFASSLALYPAELRARDRRPQKGAKQKSATDLPDARWSGNGRRSALQIPGDTRMRKKRVATSGNDTRGVEVHFVPQCAPTLISVRADRRENRFSV
jgi:hypothetical protein